MDSTSYHNAARNLILLKHTKDILRVLRQENIPVIVLKGIALVETVYPHIGMREIADIDLLVKEKDLLVISKKLTELNYKFKAFDSVPWYELNSEISIFVQLHTQILYLREKEIWDNQCLLILKASHAMRWL